MDPSKRRSHTDVFFAVIFVFFLLGWVFIAVFVFIHSDSMIGRHLTDSEGRKCGIDYPVENFSYLYIAPLSAISDFSFYSLAFSGGLERFCVYKCPEATYSIEDDSNCTTDMYCRAPVNGKNNVTLKMFSCSILSKDNQSDCLQLVYKSYPFMYICLPDLSQKNSANGSSSSQLAPNKEITKYTRLIRLNNLAVRIQKVFVDHSWLLLAALALCIVVSVVWLLLLQHIAGVVLCLPLFALPLSLAYGCYRTWLVYWHLKGVTAEDSDTIASSSSSSWNWSTILNSSVTWLGLFVLLCTVGLLMLLIVCVLWRRLRLAVALVRQASVAVRTGGAAGLLLEPLAPALLRLLLVVYFVALGLAIDQLAKARYTFSNVSEQCTNASDNSQCKKFILNAKCDPDTLEDDMAACGCADNGNSGATAATVCSSNSLQLSSVVPYLQVYNLVAVLWSMAFITAWFDMAMVRVVVSWYWTFDKRSLRLTAAPTSSCGGCRMTSATVYSLTHNMGTMALASLLLTYLRLWRFLVRFIAGKLRQCLKIGLLGRMMCCCKTLLWCMDQFLRYINRSAYIMCIMCGKGYCWSARQAFALICDNALTMATVDSVFSFLLLVSQQMLTAAMTMSVHLFMESDLARVHMPLAVPPPDSRFVVLVLVAVTSYVVTGHYLSPYHMAVDTIHLCVLKDIDQNDGSPQKPFYMPQQLAGVLGLRTAHCARSVRNSIPAEQHPSIPDQHLRSAAAPVRRRK